MTQVFVSYGTSGPGGIGISQAILTVDRPPSTTEDVLGIREFLQSQTPYGMTVAIISWQVLGGAA